MSRRRHTAEQIIRDAGEREASNRSNRIVALAADFAQSEISKSRRAEPPKT